ncbi:hypothetical protein [Serinibacter arcticus]|uniref:Pericardin n=1 Tax=Serinibacter arcticus TaxID=1655435 RepID=A0A4Z1DYD4_9MICO|nr:hypothetical protein [Serinibacter arcticus]TGO04030.1 pericardin [Serinibacter arcticus]
MSERPREDDRTTRSTSDPYGYLTAGEGEESSYLPGAVDGAGAEPTAPTETDDPAAPAAPKEGPEDDDVTVGMTRRELRERRARRAERAAAAASVPTTPAESDAAEPRDVESRADGSDVAWTPKPEDGDESATDGTRVDGVAPAAATAPVLSWGTSAASRSLDDSVAPAANDADDVSGDDVVAASTDPGDPTALAPGWHDPGARTRERGRRRLLWVVLGLVVAAAIAVAVLLLVNRGEDTPTAPATSATESAATGLAALIPASVNGGEFSESGPTGVTYLLDEQGLVENPLPPAGAAESLTALYTGGTADVTLTASTFATADEALAAATAISSQLGTAVDTGVVFPDTGLGTYWTYNNDGLVTVVWHAGTDGVYVVVSEDAEDALGFYNGLDF